MKFFADFHIHSKYSRATSKDMDLESLDKWAKIKGIKVLGTGDFTHFSWFKNLKEKLIPAEPGLFKLKNTDSETRFILTTEISCIYTKGGKVRKIHIITFAPSFEVVEKINVQLGWIGNLKSDGRPILGLDAKELAKIVLNSSENCLVVPAHLYTPWFSLFGSRSGFDSIEECFEDYSKYIYAGETGLSCYDEKTEILTNNGWKKFSEVNYGDKICTLNAKTNQIEFQKLIGKFAYKYKGKMYKLRTKRVDLLVTPNHKLFVKPGDVRNSKPFFLKETQYLFSKSKQFKKDGIWTGKNKKYFTLPSVKIKHRNQYYKGFRNKKEKLIPMRSWLKFFGFWIAEGCTSEGKNGDYNVFLSSQNKELLSEMKKLLENFGYNVYREDGKKIRVRDYQLLCYLKQFGKSHDKFIPPEIKSLSKELLEILFKHYLKGDGHIYGRTRKGLLASTSSVRLRDDLQEIALKIGISAYYKLDKKKGTIFRSPTYNYKRVYKQKHDTWKIYFIRRNKHAVLPSTIKRFNYIESWVDFNGKVFSVAVPNQIIYVRRNGIPVWCGNSDPPMSWRNSALDRITLISNSDSHSPQKVGREANVFDLEDLSYQSITEAIKNKDPKRFLYTIEFFPEEGKYHYDGHRNCNISLSPEESKKYNNLCPVCGKPLTIGVLNRVEELADRPDGFKPEGAIPYKSLIPLEEIIADSLGLTVSAKQVEEEYKNLIKQFGNEFNILLDVPRQELETLSHNEVAEGIIRTREGKVFISPGYDGVYGKVRIFNQGEQRIVSKQKTLF
ncbi:MAG: hypothetical protein COX90_02445 [Candidatus Nealsonbacteria bacterium CG_4_10_14_0_2_um_filter_38_17]|uniref:DOD-type homing endonuclease domain-containing protein n=1 Tax=Candidatus Nealsonbacteria bacterium CG_4_10_14_0_2_um_filter_38_17 TaxID=1974680 RepID=A0A2M7UXZ2_9BACT|nr:MAG: hypothetical protein COX90_02445 [Candidatus Nealsonbacteria bacterium CG_4_10_14_0_2_um_filter_38_17]